MVIRLVHRGGGGDVVSGGGDVGDVTAVVVQVRVTTAVIGAEHSIEGVVVESLKETLSLSSSSSSLSSTSHSVTRYGS